jgi:imidazoleglycerol-phosphate dehydratase
MRKAVIKRTTKETDISVEINLDGSGRRQIQSGIPFFDHMLDQFCLHGLFDLKLEAAGDLEIDAHHTIEDCALALGQAIDQALSDRKGIVRMGFASVPMDDSLAQVSLDLSGRPYTVLNLQWAEDQIAGLPSSLIAHFLESLGVSAKANLHASIPYGKNGHHQTEALFKALGRALDQATSLDARRQGVIPSTKGQV